jgi:hypothetical protein
MVITSSSYYTLGGWDSQGKPDYLTTDEPIDPEYLNRVRRSLPELGNVIKHSPQYLTNTATRNVIIRSKDEGFKGSDIYVTFIDEGAGYLNVLGYYVYDLNGEYDIPTIPEGDGYRPLKYSERDMVDEKGKSILRKTIIFPNGSRNGSGGSLKLGNRVKLLYDPSNPDLKFPNNTGVGFFLIPNGWDARLKSFNHSSGTIYSDNIFNTPTVSEPNGSIQTILLMDEEGIDDSVQSMVIGIEDIMRPGGDADFNDMIIKVTHTANIEPISGRLTLAPTNPITENTSVTDSTGLYINLTDPMMLLLNKISTDHFKISHVFKKKTHKKASLLKTVLEDIDWEYEAVVDEDHGYDDEEGFTALRIAHHIPKDRLNKFLYLMKSATNNTRLSRLDPNIRNIVYFQNDYVFDDEIDPEYFIVTDGSDNEVFNLNGRPNRSRMVSPLAMGDPHFTTIDGRNYTIDDLLGNFALINNDYLTINTAVDFYPPNTNIDLYKDLTFMKHIYVKYGTEHFVLDFFQPGIYYQLVDGDLVEAPLPAFFELVQDETNSKIIEFQTSEMGKVCLFFKFYLHIGDLVNDFNIRCNGLFVYRPRGLMVSVFHTGSLPTIDSVLPL